MKQGSKRLTQFKSKLVDVAAALGVPLLVYAATGVDEFRKPRTGMWNEILKDLGARSVNLEESYFVGDAAGRPADHGCSDRKLAANIGIPFLTPEEFFLGHPAESFSWGEFQPASHSAPPEPKFEKLNKQDILLCVGPPCSGKSSFARKVAEPLGYTRLNQDSLKSRDQCLKVADIKLQEGGSVIVDNTNADKATRKLWVDLARRHNVPIRCLHFKVPIALAEHNNAFRAFAGISEEKRDLLPKVAFTGFSSRFQAPSSDEGFQDIFVLHFHCDEEQKDVWMKWWKD